MDTQELETWWHRSSRSKPRRPREGFLCTANAWRSKDGSLTPLQELSDKHLINIARMLSRTRSQRGQQQIRRELFRRGLERHLRPSYPNL